MRIAVILGHWQNYGVETLTMNLFRNIDKSKIQFDFIVCETPDSDIPSLEIEELGGRVFIIPSYTNYMKYKQALKQIFENNNYTIVHCHMSTLCVFPLRIAKQAEIPIRIAHCHTMAGKGEYVKNAMKYSLRLFSHYYPTHYATSSKLAGEWLFGPKVKFSQMYYLPVARNIEEYCFNARTRDSVRDQLGLNDKFVVGHLGRFVPQKNHSFLVDVFKRIYEKDKSAVLLLAGDGPLVENILAKVKNLHLEEAVLYLGRRSDACDLYQAMDVFVLPSIYEGVPGTGIEAQAAGLPFVFSTAITEEALILDSAKRLPLESGEEYWAEEIESVKDTQRVNTISQMTEAGYNIKNAAKDLCDYYESLVEQSKCYSSSR